MKTDDRGIDTGREVHSKEKYREAKEYWDETGRDN